MKNMVKYSLIQGFFWMLFCSCYGYITFYLERRGFTTGEIGLITAAFGIGGAFLQPVLGRMEDTGRSSWKKLTMIVLFGNVAAGFLMVMIPVKLVQGLLFGFTELCTTSIMPLINRAGFVCQTPDQKINFGIARGIGSLSYALLSLILGRLTVLVSDFCVPLSTAIVAVLLEIAVLVMPEGEKHVSSKSASAEKTNVISVLKKYPVFFLIWISCVLQMTFHNLSSTFLMKICEQAGGDSGTMGIALAIAAVLELPFMFCFTLVNKHISAKRLLFISGVAFVVKGVLYILSGNIGILFLAQTVQCVSFAVYASASVYYAEEAVGSDFKTTAQAFMGNSQTIGSVIGCLLGGVLIQMVNLQFALIVGTILVALGVLITIPVNFRKNQ